ncbi:hypothetical protein [Haloarchaeobius sp. HME9146]|uniref:hypothetical protein n=1 Tax=Haloarchaeobius sp. HME9146 TaxID=2978732 RepID=UPI0021BE845A|nr:hypothetical protein [Haloarchaeobius sp. HME9146]MCT9095034.1 hypothetical protein [Haloarchaeobius sp. HME9146]
MPSQNVVDAAYLVVIAIAIFVGLVEDAIVFALVFALALRFLLVAERIETHLRD